MVAGRRILLLAVFAFYLLQNGRLGGVNETSTLRKATNASIQASIAEKQQFADLQAEAQTKQALLATAYAGRGVVLRAVDGPVARDPVRRLRRQPDACRSPTHRPKPTAAAAADADLVGAITMCGKAVSVETVCASS